MSAYPGSSEDITWDTDEETGAAEAGLLDATEAGLRYAEAGARPRPAEAAPRPADAEPGLAEAELGLTSSRLTEDGPGLAEGAGEHLAGEAEDGSAAGGAGGDNGTPVTHAGPHGGESGRWFRPALAEFGFLALAAGSEPLAGADAQPPEAAGPEGDSAGTGPEEGSGGTGPERADGDTGPDGTSAGTGPERTSGGTGPERTSGGTGPERTSGDTGPEGDGAGTGIAGAEEGTAGGRPADAALDAAELGAEVAPQSAGPPAQEAASGARATGTAGQGATAAAPAAGTAARGAVLRGAGTAVPGVEAPAEEGEEEDEKRAAVRRRVSRRAMLQAGLIGGAGVAALPLLALVGGMAPANEGQPGGLTFSLNANWLFGGEYMAGSESSFYDDSGFAPVVLPHTVTPLSWRRWDPGAWQRVWIYRRHFHGGRLLGSRHPGNRILVDFDGVMVNATVVINDRAVGSHQGGYLPWSAELTGHVRAGGNLLAVIVDSRCLPVPPVGVGRGPESVDFFQPGGIYRDVRLRVLPQVFLSDLFALPVNVLSPRRRVDVECAVDSALTGHASGTVLVELFDGPTQIAAEAVSVNAGPGISTAKLSLTDLGRIGLWSTGNPKLYTVRATLNVPGIGSHVLTRRIGFREASFQPEGFFLNGERLQLFGLDRHQLYPYAGMAMPARVQRKDVELLKYEFNCNMVRCSHYPQSPHFLDACDELGLLVWEEAPGWHNVSSSPAWQDLVVQNVRDMVIRDRSRPSVIIWGTRLNETPPAPGLWDATRQAAAELDSSRPSSGAMAFHNAVGWAEDVFAYNDYGINARTGDVRLKPPFAGLPYLITEAVGVEHIKPQQFAWTDSAELLARQAALHGQAQSTARSGPGYSGMLAWAGFDYASLLGRDPEQIKWAGVADGFRVPKPGAAIYQSQVDPARRPVIIPVFFWEPGGAVPAPDPTAMVASNCDQLEVFIGGTQVASVLPASDSPLYGGLVHPPFLIRLPALKPHKRRGTPELLIRGYLGGRQVAERRMSADPAGDTLSMTADDPVIMADGSDATRVVFRAVDAYGNQRRFSSGQVQLSMSGPGMLVGDNPFEFGAYGGLGAVWIRSLRDQPGTITLVASHPHLGQAQAQVVSSRARESGRLA